MAKLGYKRILLKLSGETLISPNSKYGVDFSAAARIASEIKKISKLGIGIGIVIGGGNIFRGASLNFKGLERTRADAAGMLATIINSLALQTELERLKVPVLLYSSLPMPNVVSTLDRKAASGQIDDGGVVIFSGGTGNPFFSTDTAAVLRALEINAEVIFKGTKVDGVYDSDPMKNKSAKKFEKLTYLEALKRKLKIMDATAISMCMEYDVPIVVFNVFKDNNLERAVKREVVGTMIG